MRSKHRLGALAVVILAACGASLVPEPVTTDSLAEVAQASPRDTDPDAFAEATADFVRR